MFALAALNISLTGVIYFLIAVAVLCLLVAGLRYLMGLMGVTVPQPIWAIIAFILFLLLILYALGAFGGAGGISVR
jgi:hypothetical protein